jgi:hypothetical protein
LQSQLTNWEKEKIYLMAKKQEAEKELQAKEAELDVVSLSLEKETIESEAISIGMPTTRNLAITATLIVSNSRKCMMALSTPSTKAR